MLELTAYLTEQENGFWATNVSDTDVPIERRRRAIRLWSWVSSNLILNLHPHIITHD